MTNAHTNPIERLNPLKRLASGLLTGALWALCAGLSGPAQAQSVQNIQWAATERSQTADLTVQCASGQFIGGLSPATPTPVPMQALVLPCLVKVHGMAKEGPFFALMLDWRPMLEVSMTSTDQAKNMLGQSDLATRFDRIEELVPQLASLKPVAVR